MKTRKIFIPSKMIVVGFLCLLAVGIPMSALPLAQTEPCTVEVTATCTGSTDCSGYLGGGITVKNTGSNTITCQMVHTGFLLQDEVVLLSTGENYGYGWAEIPIGCGYRQDFYSSGRVEAHCQVGCNPDATCEAYDEWQCSATCEATVPTDIKPGACPNTISLREKGSLPVAIIGDADLDLAKVDPASIRLSREGIAATVAPTSWNFKEIGSPFAVELCECIRSKRDVYSDLVFNFDVQQVINALGLSGVLGQTLPLTMTGRMTEECDGRTYIKSITGKDCALIQR
jgi:hypothetical protein